MSVVRWPILEDYQAAIQNRKLCLKDLSLKKANVECRYMGLPFPRSGNYGAIYKFEVESKTQALKVFTRFHPEMEKRYLMISKVVNNAKNPFLIKFQFDAEGILVKGKWYPILIMDWVEGRTLDKYLNDIFQNNIPFDNRRICLEWISLVKSLNQLNISHGDLQHGNILIDNNGKMFLVDYDGMFVPTMKGMKAIEGGLPSYQHPKRGVNDFNERLDDFSSLIILLQLAVVDKKLWDTYHDDNHLIIGEQDIKKPSSSVILQNLKKSKLPHIEIMTNYLLKALSGSMQDVPRFDKVISEPEIEKWLKISSKKNISKEQPIPSWVDNILQNKKVYKPLPSYLLVCKKCNTPYGKGILYCANCGQYLVTPSPKFCGNCGKALHPNEKICGKCGEDISIFI